MVMDSRAKEVLGEILDVLDKYDGIGNTKFEAEENDKSVQQQQEQDSTSPSSTTSEIPAGSKMTPEEFEDLKKRSRFGVRFDTNSSNIPSLKLTAYSKTMKGYDKLLSGYQDCEYFNAKSGIYKTPVKGVYKIGVELHQMKEGHLQIVLHRGKMYSFFLGATTSKGYNFNSPNHDIRFDPHLYDTREVECEEGENLWVNVERCSGWALQSCVKVGWCAFYGQLIKLL